MNNLPTITVVTPSLNQAQFIRETIDSVLMQEYPNLEYLVVDGGSTDGTREILESYGSAIHWISEPDHGQSSAINKGWSKTNGEIVAWLNSDDVYPPDSLKKVGAYFRDHPDVGLLYGECDVVSATGEVLYPYPTHDFDRLDYIQNGINYIPQPAAFFQRQMLETIGGVDETLSLVMDFDLWLRISLQYPIKHIPEKLANLRLHHAAKSVDDLGKFAPELIRCYQNLFARPDLPSEVAGVEKLALANIYNRAADCAYWADDWSAAREYALLSFKYRKFPLRFLWFWIFLGRFGKRFAGKNPYLP